MGMLRRVLETSKWSREMGLSAKTSAELLMD